MDSENSLDQFLSKYKYQIALGIIGLVLLIGGMVSSGVFKTVGVDPRVNPLNGQTHGSAPTDILAVDISGEVSAPGVYNLKTGARIEDALNSAGGLTQKADPEFLSKNINLAQKVTDGMKIYIPAIKEAGVSGTYQNGTSLRVDNQTVGAGLVPARFEGLVNINEASLQELDSLPGVGEVTAEKIIENRPYSSLEELVSKKAVSRATFEKIKDKITIY